jgi:citrate synthase
VVVWIDEDVYLDAREACELLRVKPQTLYAYVSRGLLRSFRQGIKRQRLYLRREAEALVRLAPGRGRGRVLKPAARAGRDARVARSGRDRRGAGRVSDERAAGTGLSLPRAEEWIGDR